ncbi:uncharacterized protein BKA55DRAFT_580788 [Fusarium redolens]|uniref:Uncharacterized protein n=1 Tax=Fusarium redolens TaxID=48865 RepID=A0A9P9G445_FUSRE|nr:uncharacterized protein BKA55DRAFT_580788 [Fusarium redolens]KAH7232188.1 hypothetical protein BKA55DRAFT_580788 [Fusarium redolens]
MAECPFKLNDQLCDEMNIDSAGIITPSEDEHGKLRPEFLPGCPRINLNDPNMGAYLTKELLTPELNEFEPYLWLVAKQDGTHISSLTEQIVRGRNIIITEKPSLHLVWAHNRIFIKPLPLYLLSRPFWDYYLLSDKSPIARSSQQDILQAANGLLRSYSFLVQHESDFAIATDEKVRLVPREISYTKFAQLTRLLEGINNKDVSPRFHFGELRLTRLNFWYKVFLLGFNYSKVDWQYSAYMARFYAPILFIFAIFSVVLAAMQVNLAVDDSQPIAVRNAYRGFSNFTLHFILVVMAFLLVILIIMVLRELIFAISDLIQKKRRNI